MWYKYALDKFNQDDIIRAQEWRKKQDEKDRIYREERLPSIVAQMLINGLGIKEIARKLKISLPIIIEAMHRYEKQEPGFAQRLIDEIEPSESILRELNLAPAEYDPDEGILRGQWENFERLRDPHERIISEYDAAEKGMNFPVNMESLDPSLKGWRGVHVGDPEEWFPHLVRDQFVDSPAHSYKIYPDSVPLFEMDDPHPIDKGEAPASWIIFTHPEFLKEGKFPPESLEYGRQLNIEDFDDENFEDEEYY